VVGVLRFSRPAKLLEGIKELQGLEESQGLVVNEQVRKFDMIKGDGKDTPV